MAETFTIGIIGGGQLALMMGQSLRRAQAHSPRPLELKFFLKSQNEPAFLGLSDSLGSAQFYFSTSFADSQFKNFAKACDILTLESEFFCPTLNDFKILGLDPHVLCPSFGSLEILTDKYKQKQLAKKLGIPTSDFFDLSQTFPEIFSNSGEEWVLKWSTGGYDGRGTYFLDSLSEIHNPTEKLKVFLKGSDPRLTTQIFVEKKIKIKAELALSCVRLKSNPEEIYFFPLIFTEQKNGVCAWAELPIPESLKIPSESEKLVQSWLKRVCENLKYFGLLTVELFLDDNDTLWVNEWAPRVHNSLHLSREACKMDQFTAHLCALLPESKGITQDLLTMNPKLRVIMKNILGTDELQKNDPPLLKAQVTPLSLPQSEKNIEIFLQGYGKKLTSLGRKMGHLCGRSPLEISCKQIKDRLMAEEEKIWK